MFISFPKVNVAVQGMDQVRFPRMIPVRQIYDRTCIQEPGDDIAKAMEQTFPDHNRFRGKRLAVTVGSRGIPHLAEMVQRICQQLKNWGAEVFIVPAMGSHGGAQAKGQAELLTEYGITEDRIGVPICSSMEVVQYGEVDGLPLYCDKLAFEADGIVVFNKVKPHTDFRGNHESGLAKMIAIGLGNHKGASEIHSLGFDHFADLLPKVAQCLIETGKIAFGVGIVQNAYDDVSDIQVCRAEELLNTDAQLLEVAKKKLARLKLDHIDLLIVDEMGKNISGTGMDPNVVGRNLSGTFHGILDLKKLFVRGLTPESHHSGVGLGMVDMTTRACLNDVDWEVTWANVMTTGSMQGGRIPMYANSDAEAIKECLCACHCMDPEKARVVRIKNTMCLEEIQISEAIYDSLKGTEGIEKLGNPVPMCFSEDGTLL